MQEIDMKKDQSREAAAKTEDKAIAKPEAKAEEKPKTEAKADAERKDAGPGPVNAAAPPKEEQKPNPEQQEMTAKLKEMESAMFALRFYPVAVNASSKDEAVKKLERIYNESNETVRQMLLYMVHENLSTSMDLKLIHTLEYFKMKNPGMDPSQQRMNVYRAIFNYNTSLEGLTEVIRMLGRLEGDDAAKLLTYHYSHLAFVENEATHVLRAAILDALGGSSSRYALMTLLEYARYTDNERVFGRIVSALMGWEERLDRLKMSDKEKGKIRNELKKIITSEFGGSHYG
ncbi:MAG: cell envelope integrity protein TolA [Candidatus Micrarchaeota archaeon]